MNRIACRRLPCLCAVAVCLTLGLGACAKSSGPQAGGDGVSHWLQSCGLDSECNGLDCLCGVCTRQCSDATSCESFGAAAVCARVAGDSCELDGPEGVCTKPDAGAGPVPDAGAGSKLDAGLPGDAAVDAAADAAADAMTTPPDAGACTPLDARWDGTECLALLGYTFTGRSCEAVLCGCEGTQCDALYEDAGECRQRHAACLRDAGDPCAPMLATSDPNVDCNGWSGYVWNGRRCEGVCDCQGPDCDRQYGTLAQCDQAQLDCIVPAPFRPQCQAHRDCSLVTTDCCACFEAGPDDVVSLLEGYETAAYEDYLCQDAASTCGDCPAGQKWPTLYPICEPSGDCAVLDATPYAACDSDADCVLAFKDCCECGADASRSGVVAVSDAAGYYRELACDPGRNCPECPGPLFPNEASPRCDIDEGRCFVEFVPD